MGMLEDLLGNLLQVEGVDQARRRIWNFLNGPTLLDDQANKRLTLDWGTIRGALASTLLRGTVNPIGANGAVLKSDGATAGGVWGLPTNLLRMGLASSSGKLDAQIYCFTGALVSGGATAKLTRVDDGSDGIPVPVDSTITVMGLLSGKRVGASEGASYTHTGVGAMNIAGTLTTFGTPGFTVVGESDATWDASFLVDDVGDKISVQVLSDAGTIVDWSAFVLAVKAAN